MVDNFELINSLLSFPDGDTFYTLDIIRRGKDHPDLPSANRTIKSYYICEREKLGNLRDEIIKLCEFFGARAYMNVAPKSKRKVTLLQMKYLAERLFDGDLKKIWKSWSTSAGTCKSSNPRWVVDIDNNDKAFVDAVKLAIYDIQPVGDKIIATVPTNSGYHLITKPFNLLEFKKLFPDIDIHKNNPTVLYIP